MKVVTRHRRPGTTASGAQVCAQAAQAREGAELSERRARAGAPHTSAGVGRGFRARPGRGGQASQCHNLPEG